MTDDLPELTPAETERVRRLLAEARHTDPMPAAVAERLDRTLATLTHQQRELETRTVTSLAARRRRRSTQLLVAAVAVVAVAVGAGVGQLVSGMDPGTVGASGGDSGSAGSAADQGAVPEQSAGTGAGQDDQQSRAEAAPPRVDDGTFETDAAAARKSLAAAESSVDSLHDLDCDRLGWGPGQRVVVVYHGDFAALVFRPAARGTQVVDLFACDGDVVLRSGSVPAS
ncbi:hypothetical protein [Nocardioides sp. LHG3406-4]|uniref:hypothetical protein n=1 Tax=Nocardioides sp. LHG3406-4 TaxID=2804575 RepID=UPI003CEE8818